MIGGIVTKWICDNATGIVITVLASNTAFQKLPIRERDDLLDTAVAGCKFVVKSILSLRPKSAPKDDQMTALKAELQTFIREQIAQAQSTIPPKEETDNG